MSKEVKRYNFDVDKFGSPRAYESEHGRWMKRADYDALLAERDELKRDVEILEREAEEYSGLNLLLDAVRYRLRREVGDEVFGAARVQRIFLLGYHNAARLLQILTTKGDLVPAGANGHQRKFAALQGEQP